MENESRSGNKFWKGVLVGALVTAFAGLLLVGVGLAISLVGRMVIDDHVRIQAEGDRQEDSREIDLGAVNYKINTLEALVDRDFLFEEDIDAGEMEAGIYKGMMAGLGDPYTCYYTKEEYEALTEETEGTYCGIGALISQNMETGVVTILRVFKGSPAERAGLKKWDILYKVGDIEATTMDLDVLVQQEIRGPENTTVELTVLRNGEEVKLRVRREIVEVDTVEYQMLDENTGYIMITQFEMVSGEQFKAAVENLEKQGMKNLVIDLRDNPGGVLDAAVDMSAYIVPEDELDGVLVSTADKNGKGDRYYSEDGEIRYESQVGQTNSNYPKKDGHELDMPIAILMNGNSASAAEVFAGALRDYGKAKLVGTTSFGKGIVQSLIRLNDGSAVKITTSHYYTPAGVDLHKKGLEPDVEVEYEIPEDLPEDALEVPLEQDNQVRKAMEVVDGE